LEFICGSPESSGFSWTLIQAQRELVELRLREGSQVRSSREVSSQQQIRIFKGCLVTAAPDVVLAIPEAGRLSGKVDGFSALEAA
jgi:hypothetical protein